MPKVLTNPKVMRFFAWIASLLIAAPLVAGVDTVEVYKGQVISREAIWRFGLPVCRELVDHAALTNEGTLNTTGIRDFTEDRTWLLAKHPSFEARKIADAIRTGKEGRIPNPAQADAIESHYDLVARWPRDLVDAIRLRCDQMGLDAIMSDMQNPEDFSNQVELLAYAFLRGPGGKSAVHEDNKPLDALRDTIGKNRRYWFFGPTVEELAAPMALEWQRQRSALLMDPVEEVRASKAFVLSKQGFTLEAYRCGDILLSGKHGFPRNPNLAANYFRFAAGRGMPAAQHNLATCYRDGVGVPRDAKAAFFWYHEAARRGFSQSSFNVGLAYLEGAGVAKDKTSGLAWVLIWKDSGLPPPDAEIGARVDQMLTGLSLDQRSEVERKKAQLISDSLAYCRGVARSVPFPTYILSPR